MGSRRRRALTPDSERLALVMLRLLPGVGDRRLARLIRIAGNARLALVFPGGRALELLGPDAEAARRDSTLKERAERLVERCEALEIEVIGLGSTIYPERLLALVDPPPVLFLRGDRALMGNRSVAVIGSRRATGVGRRAAERISQELSELGVTVVSGLALGIDAAAHRGALPGPGRTIAVLGSGPDRPYPSANRALFQEILQRGLLVSEFPPEASPRPHHFPRRNRILAALTTGVVVVEAARRSGALITVDHALDLGLEVFAVPGSVESPQSEGTNALIRDGAHLATSGSEIAEVLGWEAEAPSRRGSQMDSALSAASASRAAFASGTDLEVVSAAFGPGPLVLDQLAARVRLPVPRILAALTRLELTGRIRRTGEGWAATRPGR